MIWSDTDHILIANVYKINNYAVEKGNNFVEKHPTFH